jgi:hypothetical protein
MPTRRPAEDPVLRALRLAPVDDEPETPAERRAVAKARAAAARGEVETDADLRRRLRKPA